MQQIITQLQIPPENLHSSDHIKNYIEKALEKKYMGKTFKKYGYINMVAINSFKSHIISRINGYPIYSVNITIKNILPVIGHTFNSIIDKTHINYITLIIKDSSINIIVFKKSLENMGYIYNKEMWVKNKESLDIDDELSIKVINMKYDQDKYLCIGEIAN